MCWKLRMTTERPTRKNWSESDLDTCTISWTSREKDGNCQTACALSSILILSRRAIVVRNVCMGSTSSSLCQRLSVTRDNELSEDLWPNLNAMVTRHSSSFFGSHEEKLTAREHGFDRDFWAGFPSDRTMLYRAHVKPRSSMFDPRDCVRRLPFQLAWKFCHARLICEKHGVAALHSSSTTSTMTRTFCRALLKGASE